MASSPRRDKLALVVGGGPAPGINGVISAVTIEAINGGMEVIGFQDGFKYLAQGDPGHSQPLTIPAVKRIHLRGGSILGTARTNPAASEAHLSQVLEALHRQQVTALVTIGGDDTAYSASQVYVRAAGAIRVRSA